jgi:pyruvate dehydrogenase phosphatase
MRREHPGEPEVVMNGRVLGQLEPTRAFGDAAYKWSIETQERIKAHFFGRTPNRRLRTPPYVTAEPVVTTTKVQPEQGDFLVMATDGLWEMLTNEEVVGLVGQWVEEQERSGARLATGWAKESRQEQKDARANSWLKGFMSSGGGSSKGLPVEMSQQDSAGNGEGQKAPIRQRQWGMDPQQASSRFVVQDKNVATHLVRNALGGRDQDQLCALLTLPSPYSRRYRDDLTVEVIFFGQSGASTGNVTLNLEASAAGSKAQAKL